jgi:hypothetical protein
MTIIRRSTYSDIRTASSKAVVFAPEPIDVEICGCQLLQVSSEDDLVLNIRDSSTVIVFISACACQVQQVIARCKERVLAPLGPAIILGLPDRTESLFDLIEQGDIYYLSQCLASAADLPILIESAIQLTSRCANIPDERASDLFESAPSALSLLMQLGQQSELGCAARLLEHVARQLAFADQYCCLIKQFPEDSLYRCDKDAQAPYIPATGITGYAVRTQSAVHVLDVSSDWRFDPDIDTPVDSRDGQLLVLPLLSRRWGVTGVLKLNRWSSRDLYGQTEIGRITTALSIAEATFDRLVTQAWLDLKLLQTTRPDRSETPLFREEALRHYQDNELSPGALLRVSSRWVSRLYALLLISTLILGFGLCVATVASPIVTPAKVTSTADLAQVHSYVVTIPLRPELMENSFSIGTPVALSIPGYPALRPIIHIDEIASTEYGARAYGHFSAAGPTFKEPVEVSAVVPHKVRLIFLLFPSLAKYFIHNTAA